MMDLKGKRVMISRTDSIGDVMLTLPICSWIKENFEDVTIVFLGSGYTRPIIDAYHSVNEFVDWASLENSPSIEQSRIFSELNIDVIIHVFPNRKVAALAKKVKIKVRIGTSHRAFHLLTCTNRVNFTRKNSNLHEAQLNHELLRPLGLKSIPSLDEVTETTTQFVVPDVTLPNEFASIEKMVILHPKSQGSAKEWPIEKYIELGTRLTELGKKVVFTGTESEGLLFRDQINAHKQFLDSTGKLTLEQLMVLISKAQGLVACSTGPLHIAGFLGVRTVGLFSPKRPIHPGRWKALGKEVRVLVNDDSCVNCKKGKPCNCIAEISVERVLTELM